MDSKYILLGAACCLAAADAAGAASNTGRRQNKDSQEKPNIIIIMADDMGYSDIGCFGGEIPTPNIDALAQSGIRYTQFYNTGRSCPSRASLLTGLYAHQAGIGGCRKTRVPDRKRKNPALTDTKDSSTAAA